MKHATRRRPITTVQLLQGAVFAGAVLTALPAAAQLLPPPPPPSPTARLIEWDLPQQADSQPGAMVVDTLGHDRNRVWFVTRLGEGPNANPNVYRLETPKSLMTGNARWTSWGLDALVTGGLKKIRASYDRRFVYVRTVNSNLAAVIERIDTQNCSGGFCQRLEWSDPSDANELGLDASDVAVDDWNNVYSTHTPLGDPLNASTGYVQKLTPGSNGGAATITRWTVGGGTGLCGTGDGFDAVSEFTPCLSGVALDPSNRNFVYYVEPSTNNIARLDTYGSQVRRWSLSTLSAAACPIPCLNPIMGPRQLHVAKSGKVWVVTGSGHLVSLDPCTNRMTVHTLPDSIAADPFGLAPDDDVVGYTASASGVSKVGMLTPKGQSFCIPPCADVCVTKTTKCVTPTCASAKVACGWVCPRGKTVAALVTQKTDGTFIEAEINTNGNDSQHPLGITPVKGKSQGTFFYAVGTNTSTTTNASGATVPVNRVGFVRMPLLEKVKCPRDDDDQNDGWGGDHSWHNWHNHPADDDDDDDGIEHQYDGHTTYEGETQGDSTALAGGQSLDYPIVASATSLALIAQSVADNPLAQLGIQIYNQAGSLVATSVPIPGLAVATVALPSAGNYTVRVRNYGALPVNHTPMLIVREPVDPNDGPNLLLIPIIQ